MQVYQVTVIKKDNSGFSFGFYKSQKLAKEVSESVNESGYLKDGDKAMVLTVNVFSGLDEAKEVKKKKTSTRKALGPYVKKAIAAEDLKAGDAVTEFFL